MTNIVGHSYKPAWIFAQVLKPQWQAFKYLRPTNKLTWKSRL